MIITIDGPAGTGKSTVAKHLAQRLNFAFFDTGAMYRAVTYTLLKEQIPFHDTEKIEHLLSHFEFRIVTHLMEKRYFVGSEEVTQQIREGAITRHVSEVAALPCVRASLSTLQQRFAAVTDAVFEGRDLGSVVFPDANLKIFLTASSEVRAERRFRELLFKHPSEAENLTKQQVLEDLLRRDLIDSTRAVAPLIQPEDAHVIDTSFMTIEEVVEAILHLCFHRGITCTTSTESSTI